MRTVLVLAIVAAIILGYGYYHATTHGALYISLVDTSVKRYSGNIRDAEIRLLDGDGKLLADAKSDHQYGVVRIIHPQVGDCSAAEARAVSSVTARDEWRHCFETVSTWVIGWSDRVRFADVTFGDCDLKAMPVTLHESSQDWWLWWVPLPHIGGKPYTYFSLSISVDGSNCSAPKSPTN